VLRAKPGLCQRQIAERLPNQKSNVGTRSPNATPCGNGCCDASRPGYPQTAPAMGLGEKVLVAGARRGASVLVGITMLSLSGSMSQMNAKVMGMVEESAAAGAICPFRTDGVRLAFSLVRALPSEKYPSQTLYHEKEEVIKCCDSRIACTANGLR
jgi:hypothetical protein